VPRLLVVDGSIENGKPPIIILSRSTQYFSQISPAVLDSSFVHNAVVQVSDGARSVTLKEYQVDSLPGYSLYYYSVDSSNPAGILTGKVNSSYSLKITVDGQVYEAITTIPPLSEKIDSIWWQPTPFATDSTDVDLYVKLTDPPGLGNYYRYYTSVNQGPFLPGAQSVFNDQIVDGTTYQLIFDRGIDRNHPPAAGKNYFHRGDTVNFKLSNLDHNSYEFWLTMEFAYSSIGNPFASPNVVLGNISNGALGAFCGYGAEYTTLAIPK
ncbi:MAG: DUF4249 domain-containing protein, partial [Bacteroidota bacterium]|nr:DUF4249 domain-containing protein [Bacteroidota bacterium]